MKIIVLGSSGQVGREIFELGKAKNQNIHGYSHKELDISNTKLTSLLLEDSDFIINTAAYTNVDGAELYRDKAFKINSLALQNIARLGKPIIHLSSDYVFDGDKNGPYLESDKTNPISEYGKSKLAGEDFLRKSNERHIILRTSWVFGQYGKNFVKTIHQLSKKQKVIQVVNDEIGGPTPASEIADAIFKIIDKMSKSGFNQWGTYHFTGLPSVSWYDFAKQFTEFSGISIKIDPITSKAYNAPAMRPKNSILNCDKIKDVFLIKQPDWRKKMIYFSKYKD